MRILIALVVVAVLGWLFLAQKQQEQQKAAAASNVASQTASPRPVSEHNWPKQALDKANKVKRQVAEQRKSDGTR
jgi:hypothetical protein